MANAASLLVRVKPERIGIGSAESREVSDIALSRSRRTISGMFSIIVMQCLSWEHA